jgi:hypothetical protein
MYFGCTCCRRWMFLHIRELMHWKGQCLVWNCGRLKCRLVLILTHIFLFRVIHYHMKFLTSDRFDNRFITKDFREIDFRRTKHNKETVLPLTRLERNKYVMVMLTDIVNYSPAAAVVSKKKQTGYQIHSQLLHASYKSTSVN